MAQPVVTHSAVKSLYVGILLRVAWLDIPQRNPQQSCVLLGLVVKYLWFGNPRLHTAIHYKKYVISHCLIGTIR